MNPLLIDELRRPFRERGDFGHMTDRMLLQTRQARAAARLDTTAMDGEVLHRMQAQLRELCFEDNESDGETATESSESGAEGWRENYSPDYEFQMRRREPELAGARVGGEFFHVSGPTSAEEKDLSPLILFE
ncbi:hypothetical protein G6011_00040 [Alternaria panax]|uniref:Uncharacterized protein n=1 Tax=Alternaria panax TaxID=48097 RepID=A0AAD4NVD5_9PLEO|nr:hypothetical protein G6011_00040 [Alternaria panax]